MKKMNRFLCSVLSAVMVLGMIPALSMPVKALGSERPDVDTSAAGKYYDAGIGTGGSAALIVNGKFGAEDLTVGGVGGKISGNGQTGNIDEYNMMNCFGIYNGKWLSQPAEGFSRSNGQKVNYGSGQYVNSLNVGTYNDKGKKSGNLKIVIAENPTLKTLAESGKLQMYFKGYTSPGKEARKSWPDDHTYVWGWIKKGSETLGSSGKSEGKKKEFSSGGWVSVSANDTITIEWKVDKSAGKFSNGWADKDVGIGDCVLLFRKCDEPRLNGYTLDANGNLSYANGKPEILLGTDGRITLDFEFSEAVKTSLSEPTRRNTDHYELLSQLGSRVLFNNTEGTGYTRQGEPVYMNLTNTFNNDVLTTESERVNALAGFVKGLHYEWKASDGDYFGNNPVPGDGDWIGLASSNNTFSLIDSIVLASFHDLAGNPLKIGGKLIEYKGSNGVYSTDLLYEKATSGFEYGKTYYKDGNTYVLVDEASISSIAPGSEGYYNKRSVITGTVNITKSNYQKSGVTNPFAVDTSASSGFDFVIDAVTPTYSKTSNAVQPEILTDLVLNKGDSFDIYLNFSETVKLREFFDNGTETGYAPEDLYLKLNNGLIADYEGGIGTKQLHFIASVPDMYTLLAVQPQTWDTTYGNYYVKGDTGYTKVTGASAPQWQRDTYYSYIADSSSPLEIEGIYVETANAGSYILTDYVGNPLTEPIGVSSNGTNMNWAKLRVDNTAPEIEIKVLGDGSYQINVAETGSGVYHTSNTTSGNDNSAGIVYYVWVDGNEQAQQVADAFKANNYQKVKAYSLIAGNDSKVTVGGKDYMLSATSAGGVSPAKTGAGDWHLVVFTSDMTWDSARQLMQYSDASYKTNPSGYLAKLAEVLNVNISEMFTPVESEPADWESAYTDYYYKNGDSYLKFREGESFPVFEAGKIYEIGYAPLTEKPDGWDPYHEGSGTIKYVRNADGTYSVSDSGTYVYDESDDYTHYYYKDGESYKKLERISGVPEFRSGVYYDLYPATDAALTAENADEMYVRDSDENGAPIYVSAAEKYAPAFNPGDVYSKSGNTYTELSEEPANWETVYADYYMLAPAEYNGFDSWKESAPPVFESGTTYYTKTGEDSYSEASGNPSWNESYYIYNGTAYEAATLAPEFAPDTYYAAEYSPAEFRTEEDITEVRGYDENGVAETTTDENSQTVDVYYAWDDVYDDYYVLSGEEYVKNTSASYDSGVTYYRVSYALQSAEPANWSTEYASFLTKGDRVYTAYTAEYPESGSYYIRAASASAMNEKPADWDSAFYYYSASSTDFEPVTWITAPEFEENKYYEFGYTPVEVEPADWGTTYNQYFGRKDDDYIRLDLSSASRRAKAAETVTLKTSAPSFTGYSVYKENEGSLVNKLGTAQNIPDETRRSAFHTDMLAASSDEMKVSVVRRYYEFADAVHTADVQFMASAVNYAGWSQEKYKKDDSNWAFAISDYVDMAAPAAEFTAVEGTDNTEDVKLNVKVTDNTGIKTVKYQFAAKDAEIDVTEVNGWTEVESVSGKEKTFTVSSADANVKTGEYRLFVYTEDTTANGNKIVVKSDFTVKVNSDAEIICNISDPEGTIPFDGITGVHADIYGTAYGTDIFSSSKEFTVRAVIDDKAQKPETDTDWGEAITGTKVADTDGNTTYRYEMPEKTGVSGYYYIHLLYSFKNSKGEEVKKTVDKAYPLAGSVGEITINQLGSSDEGIVVEISASKATNIQYAITAPDAAEPTEWKTYTAELDIRSSDYKDMTAVRVWAKVGEEVRNQNFNLNGKNTVSGPVAQPSLKLLDIKTENNSRYAVIRLENLDSSALCIGAEYSVAVQSGDDAVTWKRWSPLESVIKVKLGSGNVNVLMKFRNGENVTAEADYAKLEVADNAQGSGEDYILIKRSTLREVNAATGVKLTFTKKDGTSSDETVAFNGSYSKDGLVSYVVSNINDSQPTYKLKWSDEGRHFAAQTVAATVSSDEIITVTNLRFKGESGDFVSVGASNTYIFRENGTAVFTIANEVGNTADVTANVTWLDTTPLTLDVTESYEGFETFGEGASLISNGVTLVLKPMPATKVAKAVEVNGNDVSRTMTYSVTRNGTYLITATDESGRIFSKKVEVTGIVTEVEAPDSIVLGESFVENGVEKIKATVTGNYSENNPVYDGKIKGATPVTHENGRYTIEKTFENNGVYNQYLTDSLGNTVLYTIKVTGLDRNAPVVRFPAVISMDATAGDKTENEVLSWIRENVVITDDSDVNDVTVALQGTKIKTSVPGAYTIVLAATDKAGNTGYGATTVYILPANGMLIRDGNGVLFCSSSKDASLVNRNGNKEIVLDISRYDLFDLVGFGKVRNKEAKLYITVKQGIFREGQMKYFGVLSKEMTVEVKNDVATAQITLNANDLPGTGWYTIVVRNAEREREFTTFFINADAE